MEDISLRIAGFNKNRLEGLLPLKYEAMAENLFRFYRGTNHIFYEDLAKSNCMPVSPLVWICGDLHLENFGSYKSENRLVYFDLNDFDDALLAPASWELARMVTSIFIAFESMEIERAKAMNMAELFLKSYARTLSAGKPDYLEPKTARGIVREFLKAVSKRKQKDILARRTVQRKNKLEILLDDPRHLELEQDLKEDLMHHINHWLKYDGNSPYNYKVTDAVFRLAGTGSIGVKRYALLLKSLNAEGEKYMLIDMKQSTGSALAPFVGIPQPAWMTDADRIVTIQQRMQNRPPALLSTTIFRNECFVVQEMQPTKDSIDFKLVKRKYRHLYQVIDDMGMLTASAQLRSRGRQGAAIADELIDFGNSREWQKDILQYASSYARQVKKYYVQFLTDYNKHAFSAQQSNGLDGKKIA